MYSVEQLKALGKERTTDSFKKLLDIFNSEVPLDVKREVVSSIGRHSDSNKALSPNYSRIVITSTSSGL